MSVERRTQSPRDRAAARPCMKVCREKYPALLDAVLDEAMGSVLERIKKQFSKSAAGGSTGDDARPTPARVTIGINGMKSER
jgi:hypothetical protein